MNEPGCDYWNREYIPEFGMPPPKRIYGRDVDLTKVQVAPLLEKTQSLAIPLFLEHVRTFDIPICGAQFGSGVNFATVEFVPSFRRSTELEPMISWRHDLTRFFEKRLEQTGCDIKLL